MNDRGKKVIVGTRKRERRWTGKERETKGKEEVKWERRRDNGREREKERGEKD